MDVVKLNEGFPQPNQNKNTILRISSIERLNGVPTLNITPHKKSYVILKISRNWANLQIQRFVVKHLYGIDYSKLAKEV
jgi:hypothetical protein